MIASDKTALRVGSAKLIVDGTDTDLVRKAEIALRPSRVRARLLKEARAQIAELQRQREPYEKFSPQWKMISKAVAKTYAQANRRSENWARHCAIEIVARYGVIALEDLQLVHMTKSAKGTKESPGKGVAQKKGLNRCLQDAALARLAYWICVKAEEAARKVWKVNPKDSSRECIACGHTEAANRCRARFTCTKCGHSAHADVNAAQVITARGQVTETSWRSSGCPVAQRPVPRNRRRRAAEPSGSTGPGRLPTQKSRERAI